MKEDPKLKRHFIKAWTLGEKLDKEIITYRDKYIEHIQHDHTGSVLSSDGPTSITKTHLSSKSKGEVTNVTDTISGKPHWTKMSFVDENDFLIGYYYYIHFSLSKRLHNGGKVKKGEAIGRLYDSDLGHFKKWKVHSHIFSTPNMEKPNFVENSITVSPKVDQAIKQSLEVAHSFLESCFNYLETNISR